MHVKIVIAQPDGTTTTFESEDWHTAKRSVEAYLAVPQTSPAFLPAAHRANPMETALSIRALKEQGYSQKQIADHFGVHRSVISNALRVLALPENIQELVREGRLSNAHAIGLCGLKGMPEDQQRLAQQAINDKWSSNHLLAVIADFRRLHRRD